jgi:hypothetical protein
MIADCPIDSDDPMRACHDICQEPCHEWSISHLKVSSQNRHRCPRCNHRFQNNTFQHKRALLRLLKSNSSIAINEVSSRNLSSSLLLYSQLNLHTSRLNRPGRDRPADAHVDRKYERPDPEVQVCRSEGDRTPLGTTPRA